VSKAGNIEEILRCATRLFSRQGYDNTSLRQIAHAAGVGLGTINLHFRTKENLFRSVIEQVIKEISQDRRDLLRVARNDGLTLERVLEASIWPIISRANSSDPTECGKPYLVRWALQGPPSVERHLRRLHDAISREFIEAMLEAMPTLDRRDAISGYAILIATAYSRHLLDRRYDHLFDGPAVAPGQDGTADSVQRLVSVIAEGLRSLRQQQLPGPQTRAISPVH
jgi:AcrR family transcriptional regulator